MIWAKTEIDSASLQAAVSKRPLAATVAFSFVVSATAVLWATTALAQNLPNGGKVASGNVNISKPNGNQLNINQGSNKAIVNWNGFSIGSGSQVNIRQPGSDSVILNRVTGDTSSQIHGQLNANGQVHLVNPNGIFIGPTGHVSASGFVASTLDITDEDFLNGAYRYTGNGQSQTVENAGVVSIGRGGYAALIGGRVKNSGLIRVPLGKVGLGAGEQVTLDVSGDGFLQVAVPSDSDDESMEALVTNSGRIEADGGIVHLQAASARDAARQVINMSGVIEARTVSGVSGAVVLGGGGGAVEISGSIDTSAAETVVTSSLRPVLRPQNGGDITVTGEAITLTGATLNASGSGAGDGGSIRVGGDYQGGGDLQRAQTTTVDAASVIRADGGETGNGGRIIVWSDIFTEFSGTNSARGGDLAGDGGFVEVSGKERLRYAGFTDTRAPNGETGTLLLDPTNIVVSNEPTATIDVATIQTNLAGGNVTLTTAGAGAIISFDGTTSLGGSDADVGNITIDDSITWASGFDFILLADNNVIINAAINGPAGGLVIDAAGTITTGPAGTVNVGTFTLVNGFWRQVSSVLPSFFAGDFTIESGANFLRATGGNGSASNPYQLTDIYGLQGIGGSSLNSLNFELANDIDASPTADWANGFEPMSFNGTLEGNRHSIDGLFIDSFNFGGLFDFLDGTVQNLSITNAEVTSDEGGILAGSNDGTISGVMTSGSYTSRNFAAGGLVGFNSGTIVDSFSTATVNVVTTEADFVVAGGLVGENSGTIRRSHSTGSVSGFTAGDFDVGGLVGENSGLIIDSYSHSDVSGVNQASAPGDDLRFGGLVGFNNGGTITRTYSTGSIEYFGIGTPNTGGLVGVNTGSVNASFWDRNTSGESSSAGGTGLSTSQLQNTESFFNRASRQGWNFRTTWAPGNGSTYPANYTTSPVIFVIPDEITTTVSDVSNATATGTVYGGPSVYRFGPSGDSLNTDSVFGNLDFASTEAGTTTFTLNNGNLVSADGQVYVVSALSGTAVIVEDDIDIGVPPTPTVEITPTVDTTINSGGGGGTAVTTVTEAEAALATVENASQEFDGEIAACAENGDDISAYMACLAEAMDDYAADLDSIVKGLPPGLESVGDIIRGASAGVRAAGEEANRRLALATTAEERSAIRREAVQQAQREIRQAQREIRKAITLIRATDPELVSIQNQQVETIVAAVGQAEIGLSRAIGL